MSKRIVIDPVTRIEGHAKISIFMDDAGNVSDAEFHVVEFRGFEKFCEGRPYSEMPGITPRICGICPVSHLLASAKAGDAIMAVNIPPAADKLRRLMNLGQIIQSHALSFFHLSAPDFLLGWDTPPAQAQRLRPDRRQHRPGPRRHPPAPVRPGNHRDSRRQENPSRLGRARRRAQPADRGRPRQNPRLAARGLRHHASRLRPVQEDARDAQARNPDLRQFPVAVHGPGRRRTAPGNITAANCASPTAAAASSPTSSTRKSITSTSASRCRTSSYLKSPYYKPLGFPGRHVSRRPAGAAECLRAAWACPRRTPS